MTDSSGSFYRSNIIGTCLIEVLNELIEKREISASEAVAMLFMMQKIYDEEFAKEVRSHLVVRKDLMFLDAQGTLSNYNNAEDLWRVDLQNFKLKIGSTVVACDKARVLFESNIPRGKTDK